MTLQSAKKRVVFLYSSRLMPRLSLVYELNINNIALETTLRAPLGPLVPGGPPEPLAPDLVFVIGKHLRVPWEVDLSHIDDQFFEDLVLFGFLLFEKVLEVSSLLYFQ